MNTDLWESLTERTQKAIANHDEAALREIVSEITNTHGVQSHFLLSKIHGTLEQWKYNFSAALAHFEECLGLYVASGEKTDLPILYGNIGICLRELRQYNDALPQFLRALELASEVELSGTQASIHNNIGMLYFLIGAFPDALHHYQISLSIHEKNNESALAAGVLNNIGLLYWDAGVLNEAADSFKQALLTHERNNNQMGQAVVLGNIGLLMVEQNLPDDAETYFLQARELYAQLNEVDEVARMTSNLIVLLSTVGKAEQARQMMSEYSMLDCRYTRLATNTCRAQACIAMMDGDYQGARQFLQEALNEAVAVNEKSLVLAIHRELRDIAEKEKDFDAYVFHNSEFLKYKEDLHGTNTIQQLSAITSERKLKEERNARAKEQAVLYSTLPREVADRVIQGERVIGDHYSNAAVLFLDIVDFTRISSNISAQNVVMLLEALFTRLDGVCSNYSVTKIKTIGDSYMAVAFEGNTCDSIAKCAVEMLDVVHHMQLSDYPSHEHAPANDELRLEVRIGIHVGKLTAGIIGTERLQYDVWGDTVNIASRMESTGEAGRIHVSESVAQQLSGQAFTCIQRGTVNIKGKGNMTTYWLVDRP